MEKGKIIIPIEAGVNSMKVAVLVGGIGRRIGMEKTEVKICGKKLIEIAIEKFGEYDLAFICRNKEQANRLQKRYPGYKFFWDEYENFGSLAGIHAALKNFGSCLIVAIDMPFVKLQLAEFLYFKGLSSKCDALVPKHKHAEPLLAFYSKSSLREIERAIKSGIKTILVPLERLNTIFYPTEKLRKFDPKLISFFNINTPSDLMNAEKLCTTEKGLL